VGCVAGCVRIQVGYVRIRLLLGPVALAGWTAPLGAF
jgi:hypothetical protein